MILLCTSAYFGRDCNEQPLRDRIQDPWYPINPYTLEVSSVPDRSQQLREIDLSRIFINGRVIKATVIIAIGDCDAGGGSLATAPRRGGAGDALGQRHFRSAKEIYWSN